jgi:hypothetical protein
MAPKIVEFFEDAGPLGVVAGIGAILLTPVVLPIAAGIGRPIAKSVIKGGITIYKKSREALAEAGESWEDILAETRAELAEQQMTPAMLVSSEENPTQAVPEQG